MGMCGMQGDVNGDIPGAPSPWTTAENDRSERGGGRGEKRREEEGRKRLRERKKVNEMKEREEKELEEKKKMG